MTEYKPENKEQILNKVKEIVCGDREAKHGNVGDTFGRIAKYWTVYMNNKGFHGEITKSDIAQLMILFKVARLQGNDKHLDSWEDIIGYAANGDEIVQKELMND